MRATRIGALSAALGTTLYLGFWPVPIQPAAQEIPEPPPLEGAFAPNDLLAAATPFGGQVGSGPEDVAIDAEGRVYTGLETGELVRLEPDGSDPTVVARTAGRPAGMAFDDAGHLIVADVGEGLLSVAPNGSIEVLADRAVGRPIRYADDLDIASDGTIYFSDASIYPLEDGLRTELLDGRPHGRLLAYRPDTRRAEVLLEDLYFANGVALAPDESFVLVSETFAYRIRRLWLTGPRQGRSDLFAANLPGFPDNLTWNGTDTYWVALASPRIPALETLQRTPFLRKLLMRLPSAWIPRPPPIRYGFVLGLDFQGRVAHNLQDPSGASAALVTSATEHRGRLILGSTDGSTLKILPAP